MNRWFARGSRWGTVAGRRAFGAVVVILSVGVLDGCALFHSSAESPAEAGEAVAPEDTTAAPPELPPPAPPVTPPEATPEAPPDTALAAPEAGEVSVDLPAEERERLLREAETDLEETRRVLDALEVEDLGASERETLQTVEDLLAAALDARERGEVQATANLARKARLLAEELAGEE
jgi:acyl-CoA reductase-like NAD-dependent aldehyde dehydrogenase